MPETLYRLELLLGLIRAGLDCVFWRCGLWESLLRLSCRLRAGSDCCAMEGGVTEPLDKAVPLLTAPSLEVSVEWSVRKLARERRRSSFRKPGAIVNGLGLA
jgi:hypothetical protein